MTNKIEFKLVPVELPKIRKGRKGSKYDSIIDQFSKSDMTCVRVDVKDIDPKMLAIGLRNRIKTRQIKKIRVSQRGDNVYLTKE
jgi:hypothetical protein